MTTDESFTKNERLRKTKDFRRVYKKGSAFKKNALILCLAPSGLEKNRIGFSISSRNIKLATRRNRVRRLLREAYRKNKWKLKKGFDMVFIVKRAPGKSVTYKEIEKLFLILAQEAGLVT